MGGKGGKKAGAGRTPVFRTPSCLRDEARGKNQSNVKAKTMLKYNHLKDLAVWATEVSIPPLAAFFGERLAAMAEALDIHSDPSQFVCERCETILQPGKNCTIRLEKTKQKKHRPKKPGLMTNNMVVYNCHYCSHQNTMRGTPNGYLKEILPSKPKPLSKSKSLVKNANSEEVRKVVPEVDPATCPAAMPTVEGPELQSSSAPTAPQIPLSLLDSKMKKRSRSRGKKVVDKAECSLPVSAADASIPSSKRRKKSWISLKEISERDADKKLPSSIPFFI